jgi:hypothetical protein
MVNSAKQKGSGGELELASLLTGYAAVIGVPLTLTRNLDQSRNGGHDILGLEKYKLAVEVKRVEILAVEVWWRQAEESARVLGFVPVLAYRQNRTPWRFRIRGWVYPCQTAMVVTLGTQEFGSWFQAYLRSHEDAGQS